MRVTLITDASFALRDGTGAAGWAGFAASLRGNAYFGDAFHVPIINSTNAELAAVANTLHKAAQAGIIEYGDNVLLQIDCQPAMGLFNNPYTVEELNTDQLKRRAHRAQAQMIIDSIKQTVSEYYLQIEWRYIKAHCGVEDRRYFVHNKLDRMAKRHMAIQSAIIRGVYKNGSEKNN